jgi:hypothetical protein
VPPPWNDWYHCTASIYGTWLRGDPRGWRARHHREHVDGDYRNPPPKGKDDRLHELSKRLMKRDPVHIERELRGIVVEEFALRLWQEGSDVVVGSFDDHHLHILLRAGEHDPRHLIGVAKRHTSHLLRQLGPRVEPGGIWAKRSKAIPINDRSHQLNVTGYIFDHEQRGVEIVATPAAFKWNEKRLSEKRERRRRK